MGIKWVVFEAILAVRALSDTRLRHASLETLRCRRGTRRRRQMQTDSNNCCTILKAYRLLSILQNSV